MNPRLASENSDCSQNRLEKIEALIEESKYSIHDISRMEAKKVGELSRMNMPFEIGLDFGYKRYSNLSHSKDKKMLIIDRDKGTYRYKKAFSDLSGNDILFYSDENSLITKILSWIGDLSPDRRPPGATAIRNWYVGDFSTFLFDVAKKNSMTQDEIHEASIPQYCSYVKQFFNIHPEWFDKYNLYLDR